jgi:hypothetical protein
MVQIMTKSCHAGECDHAPFPHKIVESEILERRPKAGTRGFETVKVGVRQCVICLACGHWARPMETCLCRYDCHGSGINSDVHVLD